MAGVATSSRQRSKIAPYLMILPALAYLAIFFVVPFYSLARTSLSATGGSVFLPTLTFAWDFGNYTEAFNLYRSRSSGRSGTRSSPRSLCLLLAFPLAYVIAFKAGRYKNLILGLVILPFFVTFLIRTIAWKTILADDGWVVSALGDHRPAARRRPAAVDELGGDRRADLQLDHLHDPAALRQPREDRSATARGVQGPLLDDRRAASAR